MDTLEEVLIGAIMQKKIKRGTSKVPRLILISVPSRI